MGDVLPSKRAGFFFSILAILLARQLLNGELWRQWAVGEIDWKNLE
jgi:hypothetical protein